MREAFYVPYQPTPLQARRVLVLAPHADDEVFGCGGSLARLATDGAEIEVIIISQDQSGNDRLGESCAAAAVLGYPPPTQWEFTDRGLEAAVAELTQEVSETLERSRPDLVFAPSAWEMHPDHRAACSAALKACRDYADAAQARGEGVELRLALYEIGLPLAVTDFSDITPVLEQKRRAMQCFVSQLANQRYAEQIEGLNTFRSYTLGKQVRAAEALHLLDAGRPVPWPPLPDQQDVALWRCEAALMDAHAQQQAGAAALAEREQALAKSRARAQALQERLDTIHATRGWRWLSRLKRLLGRG